MGGSFGEVAMGIPATDPCGLPLRLILTTDPCHSLFSRVTHRGDTGGDTGWIVPGDRPMDDPDPLGMGRSPGSGTRFGRSARDSGLGSVLKSLGPWEEGSTQGWL